MPDNITATAYSYPLPARSFNHHRASGDEEHDVWFDALDRLDMEDAWFDANSEFPAEDISAEKYADSRVPITEDLLRSIKQLTVILGGVKRNELFSQLFANIFPGVPVNIMMAVNSLYTTIAEKREVDSAVLHTLSLASCYLPDEINIIARLAAFIRETIISWTGASFLRDGPGEGERYQEHLYTALAVATVVASHFITNAPAPQRVLFRVPTFAANLLLRAQYYWSALGGMVQNGTLTGDPPRPPAFEVDSSIETVSYIRPSAGSGIAGDSSRPVITAFTSNSTTNPEAYTRATVENRSTGTREATYSAAETLHALVTERLKRESGLSGLQYCATRQTETRQWQHGMETTHTHLNTQCDATPHPAALPGSAAVSLPRAGEPAAQTRSAAERPYVYTVIPMTAAAAVVPHGNTWNQALKSNVLRSAGAVTVLGGLALGVRTLWDACASRLVGEKVAVSAEAHAGGPHHQRTKAQEVNIRLARIMRSAGILDETKRPADLSREGIIAAVGIALFAPNPDFTYDLTQPDKRLEAVAKMILKAEERDEGGADEKISATRAGMVVRGWLFDNVLGMPVESWLAGKLAALKHPKQFTASVMATLLKSDTLRASGTVNTGALSDGEILHFDNFWRYALDNTLPFTNFLIDDGVKSLAATDENFVWLHTGSLWLQDAGMKPGDFSVKERQTVGRALWRGAEAGDMDIGYLRYFTLPALLFEAESRPEKVSGRKKHGFTHRLKAVERYAEYRGVVAPASADLRTKMDALNAATKSWKSRGAIADKYVERCPEDKLMQMGHRVGTVGRVPVMNNPRETPDKILIRGKDLAKNRYLNDITPSGCPDVSVTAEYERETRGLADAFTAVDHYSLAAAMGGLAEEDIRFIHSDRAVIRQVSPYLRETEPHSRARKYLKDTDLFSVVAGGTERIYAFVRKKGGDYVIRRVDRNIEKYARFGLFDILKYVKLKKDDDGSVMLPEYSGGPRVKFQLFFPEISEGIDGAGEAADRIVNHFKEKRHSGFYDGMWSAGYDATAEQKLTDFFKRLIPFYDCSKGNIASCVFDVISVIPLFGKSVSLAGKFGQSLFKAMSVGVKFLPLGALTVNAVKTAGSQALGQISLPTISELASLGKTAILTQDPGFELLAHTGKYSFSTLEAIFSKFRGDKRLNNVADLDNILEKMKRSGVIKPETKPVGLSIKMACLPGTKMKVPVRFMGTVDNEKVYAIVNPETGETAAWAYSIKEGELKLVTRHPGEITPASGASKTESVASQRGKEKLAPAEGPSKKEVMDSLCPTGGRVKRTLDELCRARPFADKGWNTVFDMKHGREIIPSAYKVSLLRTVNPVRYEILQICLNNVFDIGREAERVITGMHPAEIIKSFKGMTNISLETFKQAEILRVNVLKTIKAFDFFWANDATHIVLASFPKGSAAYEVNAGAYYLQGTKAMVIGDAAFTDKNQGGLEMVLLHEASHVDRGFDYFYYPRYLSSDTGRKSIIQISHEQKIDVTNYNSFYTWNIMKKYGLESLDVANDLKRKLGFDVNLPLAASDPRVMDGMYRLGLTYADLMVENADSIALFILHLGHKPNTFNWKSADELFKKAESEISFSDSVAASGSQG
ncbi:hypothetical protein [Erwinia tasmaniensis]|nr:hypothetical protein [Erwinia tasmaniensis]